MQPTAKPKNPNFSSGPCSKRPGYDVSALQLDTLGRSHRSALGKKALALACSETARILGLPEGYRVGVVPGSDTGAVEMAMWSCSVSAVSTFWCGSRLARAGRPMWSSN
jgi:phosphoserine aminotransferase